MRVFGSVAYYPFPRENRNKFNLLGIMVGYTRQTQSYKIYDPKKREVIEERSDRFDEKRLGSKLLQITNDNREMYHYDSNRIRIQVRI